MNKTALTVALVLAVVGAGLLIFYKQRLEAKTVGGAPIEVLMAAKEIPVGTAIAEEHLGVRYLPEAYVEGRHVRAADKESVIGVRVSNQIKANETVQWTDLATGGVEARKLAHLVRVGMRGVSIGIDGVIDSGLLVPGDRVDVLITAERPGGERYTAPFLQNLLVLAVGNDFGIGRMSDEGGGSMLTLATTPDEAQRLTLAEKEGRLAAILRNPDDVRVLENLTETRTSDVLRIPRTSAGLVAPPTRLATSDKSEPSPADRAEAHALMKKLLDAAIEKPRAQGRR